jgi:hypothetical protein
MWPGAGTLMTFRDIEDTQNPAAEPAAPVFASKSQGKVGDG